MPGSLLQKVLSVFTTAGLYGLFFVKLSLNHMISALLGIIVAVGVVLYTTPMRGAYMVITLFIILLLAIDYNVRKLSKTFDLLFTIFGPINLGVGLRKVILYSKWNHSGILLGLTILEVLKIVSGIYCILTLAIEDIPNSWVIYWLLGALLVESSLGVMIYSFIMLCVLIYKDFYYNLLQNIGNWYLKDCVRCIVTKNGNRIFLEMEDLL